MKKILLTLIVVLATTAFGNAQKIETEKVFGGYKYSQDGKQLSMNDLIAKMESNSDALALLKKAKSNYTVAGVIGAVGGGLIGWPLGTAIAGGEPNWTLAGVGAGLIVVSIPITSGANKKTKKAVDLYNSSLNSAAYSNFQPEFKMIANGNGFGLSMTF